MKDSENNSGLKFANCYSVKSFIIDILEGFIYASVPVFCSCFVNEITFHLQKWNNMKISNSKNFPKSFSNFSHKQQNIYDLMKLSQRQTNSKKINLPKSCFHRFLNIFLTNSLLSEQVLCSVHEFSQLIFFLFLLKR